jgi:hypothetical protein
MPDDIVLCKQLFPAMHHATDRLLRREVMLHAAGVRGPLHMPFYTKTPAAYWSASTNHMQRRTPIVARTCRSCTGTSVPVRRLRPDPPPAPWMSRTRLRMSRATLEP